MPEAAFAQDDNGVCTANFRTALRSEHGDMNAFFAGSLQSNLVARIRMPRNAYARIVVEHPCNRRAAFSEPSATVTCPACNE